MKSWRVWIVLTLVATMLIGCAPAPAAPAATEAPAVTEAPTGPAAAEPTAEPAEEELAYPEKAIEVIVPFGAGGAVDSAIRPLLAEAEKSLGQTMVVVNKEGSGAMIGLTYASQQPADGYTLVAVTNSFVTNILLKGATFDMNSFDYVCGFCLEPAYIVVSASSDIQTLDDLIAKGKTEGLINVTPGNGTLYHIASTILASREGIEFKYVHANSGSEQAIQLAGGHAEVALTPYSSCSTLVEQGKIRVIAILNNERSEVLPDVPTAKELGYEDLNFGAYRGIAAPAGTDPAILAKLEAALQAAAENPELVETYKAANIPLVFKTGAEFKQIAEGDYAGIQSVMDVLTAGK